MFKCFVYRIRDNIMKQKDPQDTHIFVQSKFDFCRETHKFPIIQAVKINQNTFFIRNNKSTQKP